MNKPNALRRVLVATDDRALPKLLLAILAPAGFSLLSVSKEQAAGIEPKDFTLFVIDGDPKINITDIEPAVVIIAPTDAIKAYDDGADLVLNRPFATNVFMAKIRAVLRRYGISL